MSTFGEIVIAVLMVIGLVGVVIPVLPGLLLIWAAGLTWAFLDGGGPARWAVVVVLTLLIVGATVTKYVLPARSGTQAGAPRTTLLLGAVGAVVGFFVVPVIGLVIGGVGAVYITELARLHDASAAWVSTRAVLKAVGIGMLVEFAAGLLMIGAWVVAVVIT